MGRCMTGLCGRPARPGRCGASARRPDGLVRRPGGLAYRSDGLAYGPGGLAYRPYGLACPPGGLACRRDRSARSPQEGAGAVLRP